MYVSGVPADFGFNPAQVPAPVIWPQRFQLQRVTLPDGTPLLIGRLRESTASGDYLIEMGSSLAAVEALRDRLLAILALILPIPGDPGRNWWLLPGASGAASVDQISQTAAKISIGDLNARLPVPLTGDALERLFL